MAESYDAKVVNGDNEEPTKENEEKEGMNGDSRHRSFKGREEESESLYAAVLALLSPIFFPDSNGSLASPPFFHRTRESMKENLPRLREASRTSGLRVLQWARQGSVFRLLLVISVGTVTLLTLAGILVSLLFVAAATINAIIISLFMSLAAAGGFLAMFFACVAVIYVGALSVAILVISSATISAIITVMIVTGWIGFFWIVWLVMRKSACVAKHSASVTGSALSAYTSTWHARRHSHHHHD